MGAAGCGVGGEDADLLVTAPRLFDGERMIRDGAVAIRGGEIVVAGAREDVDVAELRALADSGLGPAGALRAATSEAAKVVPVDGLGRLAEGSPADVVAVRGDPIRELAALADTVLVVIGGEIQVGG